MGCSPIKAVRGAGVQNVVGTVRSLSSVGVGYLRGAVMSTRGTGMDSPLVYLLFYQEHGRAAAGKDKTLKTSKRKPPQDEISQRKL